MLKEIAQEARDRIAKQPGLYQEPLKGSSLQKGVTCTCVGLALEEATPPDKAMTPIFLAFLTANGIAKTSNPLADVYRWNDRPETTHAGAVAALDRLVDYLGTQEGE